MHPFVPEPAIGVLSDPLILLPVQHFENVRVFGDDVAEPAGGYDESPHVVERDDGRRPEPACDGGPFADDVTGSADRDDLCAVAGFDGHLGPAGFDDEDITGVVVLAAQLGSGPEDLFAGQVFAGVAFGGVERVPEAALGRVFPARPAGDDSAGVDDIGGPGGHDTPRR